jgi:hypothetical protein
MSASAALYTPEVLSLATDLAHFKLDDDGFAGRRPLAQLRLFSGTGIES